MSEPIDNSEQHQGLTRREFLRKGAHALFAGTVCSLPFTYLFFTAPSPQPSSVSAAPEVQNTRSQRDFSPEIRSAGLVPHEFQDTESFTQRVNAAINYLQKFADYLGTNNTELPITLQQLLLDDSSGNFPIALPNQRNTNILDIVQLFLQDAKSGKLAIYYDPKYQGLLGQATELGFDENSDQTRWQRKTSRIVIGPYLMQQHNMITDVSLASLLLHEFTHSLQDLKLIELLNNSPERLEQAGKEPRKASQQIMELAQSFYQDLTKKAGFNPNVQLIQFNEAQANCIAYLFLYHINNLNHSTYFPGTDLQDPSEDMVKRVKVSDGNFINQYQFFIETVVKKANSLDKAWLLRHKK